MANVSWNKATTGPWTTKTNWSNNLVPTSADAVTIGGFTGGSSATFTVTEDALAAAVGSLTITGNTTKAHSVTLGMVGNSLSISTTLALTNSLSVISGFGTL